MSDHAKLSPSAAERWLNCPGSVHMAEMFPSTSSPAAQEGTLAHALAALEIENGNCSDACMLPGAYEKELEKLRGEVAAFYNGGHGVTGDFENMRETLEPYVDYVAREYQEALAADPAAVLLTEQMVDFSDIVPGGCGTADVVVIGGGRATVIDLKYGKGVPVSAVNNPQIRLYALGAIRAFDMVYDFDKVRMVIYQPRLDQVTDEELTVEALTAWAEKVVKPAAALALSDAPPCRPGPWCDSHFCPGAGACKARARAMLGAARHSGTDPALLTDDELGDILGQLEPIQKWAKAVQGYALTEMQDGHPIPGWKIVEGRSNRAYTDEDAVAAAAMGAGYDEAVLYKKSLIGITDMERLMGKKAFRDVLGGLVEKPAGRPTLAPESDKRPAFDPRASVKDLFD